MRLRLRQPVRRGVTLVELVVSLGIFALILTAGQSAVLLTSHTARRAAAAATTAGGMGAVSESLFADLARCTSIDGISATSVTFRTLDCTGDGVADQVRYAWSGRTGDPLERSVNNGPAVRMLGGITSLVLTPVTGRGRVTASGSLGSEQLLASNLTATSTNDGTVQPSRRIGLVVKPRLSADTICWSVTRLRVSACSHGSAGGRTLFEARTVGSQLPGTTVLDSSLLPETQLGSSYGWQDIVFTSVKNLAPTDSVAFTATCQLDSNSCDLKTQTGGTCRGGDVLAYSGDNGQTWSTRSGEDLVYELYGQVTAQSNAGTANVYRVLRIAATTDDPAYPRLLISVRLLNEPPV